MRIVTLGTILALVWARMASARQQPQLGLLHPEEVPLSHFAETIVSTLSASSEHTIFLRLLQRSKCIPMLEHIVNSTVFAPTDAAWKDWAERNRPKDDGLTLGWLGAAGLSDWVADDALGRLEEDFDNQNWALRQHLLYHILNYTLPPSAFKDKKISTQTTLLFPIQDEPDHPPIPKPGAPWLPQGGEGMLGGHGQRLRLSSSSVGVDHAGEGGHPIWNGSGWVNATGGIRWVRNGAVMGLEGVLDPPSSIGEIIKQHPALSRLAGVLDSPLPRPLPESLDTSPNITFFAPSNEAFDRFDDLENRFLGGEFGGESLGRVLGNNVIIGDRVYWNDVLRKEQTLDATSGRPLNITSDSDLSVNGTTTTAVDIFASNGVIHILPEFLLPQNFSLLNSAEKVLLSMNATRFVSLLRSANLSDTYVGEDRDTAWTILAPTDDALDFFNRWQPETSLIDKRSDLLPALPVKDVSPLAALLQYHIIPGKVTPAHLADNMLLGTELRPSSLKGARQRLRVELTNTSKTSWEYRGDGETRFGGSTVIGKPVHSGKSIVYLISGMLPLPDDVLQTAVSNLQLSTFIAAAYAADLDKSFKHNAAITYFIPKNTAFASMGLVMNYLLLPDSKDELRAVLKYHAVDGVFYTQDLEDGRQTLRTLQGGNIVVEKARHNLTLASPAKWEGHDSGRELPSNGELRPARMSHIDALTSTGVIHQIDSVVLPADLQISIAKLVRGAKQSTMVELMRRAGLAWILEGREPRDEEVQRSDFELKESLVDLPEDEGDLPALPSHTLLCPSDKAFSRINITHYLSDKEALLDLLRLHIIPSQSDLPRTIKTKAPATAPRDGSPLSLSDELVYRTLLSAKSKYGDIAFRATGDNSFLAGVRGARSRTGIDAARLGQSGRATVRWRHLGDSFSNKKKAELEDQRLWHNGMTLGGGVIMLDSVLIPYEPDWFTRWGWLVITMVGIGLILLIAGVGVGWWWISRGRKEGYVEVAQDEEDN